MSFLEHMSNSALTDTRNETEYVDNGMEDDSEKRALHMIA